MLVSEDGAGMLATDPGEGVVGEDDTMLTPFPLSFPICMPRDVPLGVESAYG